VLRLVSIAVPLLAISSCNERAGRNGASGAVQWQRDSAKFEATLAKYLRDSLVIDSIARSVTTDSLEHLYQKALTAERPELVIQEISCERHRLIWRYGIVPAQVAMDRAEDRAWSDRVAVARMESRMPHSGFLSSDRCTEPEGEPMPDTLSGVSTQRELVRPVPPRRPWHHWLP
jgi:hypothetical protein